MRRSREDQLWELCKKRLKEYAGILREPTATEQAVYKASLEMYLIHEEYKVDASYYIPKKSVESHREKLQSLQVIDDLEVKQAVDDGLEYLPKGRLRTVIVWRHRITL